MQEVCFHKEGGRKKWREGEREKRERKEGGREYEQRPGNTGCVRSGLNEQRVG